MIDKIRRKLVRKYTAVIAFMLIAVFSVCSFLNLRIINSAINEALADYLIEEVREAKEAFSRPDLPAPLIHNISANSSALMSLWYLDGQLVHAEIPDNPEISQNLINKINQLQLKENSIYNEQIKHKWHFRITGQKFSSGKGHAAKVIVISNTSNLYRNFKHFFRYFSIIIALLVVLSFFLGNYFASRAIRQINLLLERQKRFVSDASHELRTPLSILLAYAELLEHNPNNAQALHNLKNEIITMTALTSKLLQFARFDHEQLKLEEQKFDIALLISNIIENFAPLVKTKQIQITLNPQQPLIIKADQGLIKQLIYILLDNAVKYSPNGSKISIHLAAEHDKISIAVKDQGIGIDPKEQDLIFERFFRADPARTRNDQGLGLGLPLARIIATLHGGAIDVQSQRNCGSIFTVVLPQKL